MAAPYETEGEFFEQIVAGERIEGWMDALALMPSADTVMRVAGELATAAEASRAYRDEAREMNVANRLTALISRYGKSPTAQREAVIEALSRALNALSWPEAKGDSKQAFEIEGRTIWMREISLSEGVGARVWTAAVLLCKKLAAELQDKPDISLLEIGSGCGLCGLFAAHIGVKKVVMTDYLESILQNLQANVDMWRGGPEAQAGDGQEVSAKCLDWNREPGIDHELMRQAKQRERDNHPDEDEDEDEENHRKEAAPLASFSSVPPGETFDLVIGADVLYEWPMAVTLPTVVKNRIASPHGKCVILNAIRFPDMSDFLIENFGKAGLDVQCETIECEQVSNMKMGPAESMGRYATGREIYEGGYVMITLTHSSS